MNNKIYLTAPIFVLAHVALIVAYVPLANLVPATLGALALNCMVMSMVLAARWPIFDFLSGGPDKSYILHRWLGCGALLGTIAHWIIVPEPAWFTTSLLNKIAAFAGELSAVGMLVLIFGSLLRFIPYHLWKKSHYLMGPLFLAAVFHTFFSNIPLTLGSPAWWVLLGSSVLGIVAWLSTIVRHIMKRKQGRVIKATPVSGGIDLRIRLPEKHRSWKPGQFVTLSIERDGLRESHPFSIACADKNNEMRVVIRGLGDYTKRLVDTVQVDDAVNIHHTAGRFLPNTASKRGRQVWVAAGVGITPFLSALDAMEPDQGEQVDLFYVYSGAETAIALAELRTQQQRLPQFNLHELDRRQGHTFDELCLPCLATGWQDGALYLCGPEGLKQTVTQYWRTHTQSPIHDEHFDFRGALTLPSLDDIRAGIPVISGHVQAPAV